MPDPLTERLRHRLGGLGRQADADMDIGLAALLCAALDNPDAPLDRYVAYLDQMAQDAAALASAPEPPIEDRLAVLNEVIVRRHGFGGDTESYDDMQNADLMRVIDRRKGLPVALGILYIQTARALGWDLNGLNFPGHFLLRLEADGQRLVLDPFNGGRRMSMPEMRTLLQSMTGGAVELRPDDVQAVGSRDVLLRLQNNIKTRAVQAGDTARGIEVLQRMVLIAPAYLAIWRELAGLQAKTGNLQAAMQTLQTFIDESDDAEARRDAAESLQILRRKLN
ncbi:MAG: transglutaminase-like domain-containing protein [Minwuiales bacterium]|nr:transglutaminase-like domain-containing protein [Minwuiales bacterium]